VPCPYSAAPPARPYLFRRNPTQPRERRPASGRRRTWGVPM